MLEFVVTMAKRGKEGRNTFVSLLAYELVEQDSFEAYSLAYAIHFVNFKVLYSFDVLYIKFSLYFSYHLSQNLSQNIHSVNFSPMKQMVRHKELQWRLWNKVSYCHICQWADMPLLGWSYPLKRKSCCSILFVSIKHFLGGNSHFFFFVNGIDDKSPSGLNSIVIL